MKKFSDKLIDEKNEISKKSGRILSFSLPAVTFALAYILLYTLGPDCDLSFAMRMTEFSLGALVLCFVAAFLVDVREARKNN